MLLESESIFKNYEMDEWIEHIFGIFGIFLDKCD